MLRNVFAPNFRLIYRELSEILYKNVKKIKNLTPSIEVTWPEDPYIFFVVKSC